MPKLVTYAPQGTPEIEGITPRYLKKEFVALQNSLKSLIANLSALGQIIEADVPAASPISLTSNVTVNVASIIVPAGTWDVSAVVGFAPSAAAVNVERAGISLTSAVQDITNGRLAQIAYANPGGTTLSNNSAMALMPCRFTFTVPTTVYLTSSALFSSGTEATYGHIRATRVAVP